MTNDVANKVMVVGLLFFDEGRRVLLVKKTHPDWQAGKWNGVGGVVEPGETALGAMTREFEEETGLYRSRSLWKLFLTETEPFGSVVHFYQSHLPVGCALPGTNSYNDAGEELSWLDTDRALARPDLIGNLKWIIPLALDWRNLGPVVVTANEDIRKKATW